MLPSEPGHAHTGVALGGGRASLAATSGRRLLGRYEKDQSPRAYFVDDIKYRQASRGVDAATRRQHGIARSARSGRGSRDDGCPGRQLTTRAPVRRRMTRGRMAPSKAQATELRASTCPAGVEHV